DDDLEFLPGLFQPLCEAAHDRVETLGIESSHVQTAADASTPAVDRALTAHFATVVIEGGQTDQSTDLLPIELAQLGQLGEQRGTDDVADAWHALQQAILVPPVVVGLDQRGDGLVHLL